MYAPGLAIQRGGGDDLLVIPGWFEYSVLLPDGDGLRTGPLSQGRPIDVFSSVDGWHPGRDHLAVGCGMACNAASQHSGRNRLVGYHATGSAGMYPDHFAVPAHRCVASFLRRSFDSLSIDVGVEVYFTFKSSAVHGL